MTVQHVGDTEARIVDGSDAMFVVEFVSADKTRDALIRKLFSGRYSQRSTVVDRAALIGALFARILR